jgi:hypothetical protein
MEELYKPIIGEHSKHNISNNNGVRVIDFAAGKNIRICSTYFPLRNTDEETCTSPDGTTRNQTGHIVIDARHATDILHVRSYTGANCNTDNFLVRAKLSQRITAMKQKTGEKTKIYNTDSLKDGEIKLKYQGGISKKPEPSTSNVEEWWERIKTSITKYVEEVIGFRPKQERNTWFDEQCQRKIEDRNNARLKMPQQTTAASVEEFKGRRRVVSNTCKKKKKEMGK